MLPNDFSSSEKAVSKLHIIKNFKWWKNHAIVAPDKLLERTNRI